MASHERLVFVSVDPLETLKNCGGYYECPKDANGKRLGPLVGYAGTYQTPEGEKNYVGDMYFNFARAEMHPHVRDYFALLLSMRIFARKLEADVFLGAPMGGIFLTGALDRIFCWRGIFAEKRYPQLATVNGREKSVLFLDRHRISKDDRVVLVEDVCNNFSTTDQLIGLVGQQWGQVVAVVCVINRSERVEFRNLPVLSVVHKPTPQYRQDDRAVAYDIQINNIIWQPKDEWDLLAQHIR